MLHLAEGQANDHKTAAAVIVDLPAANAMLADRAYSSAAFRQALVERGITPCIPPHARHGVQHRWANRLRAPSHPQGARGCTTLPMIQSPVGKQAQPSRRGAQS